MKGQPWTGWVCTRKVREEAEAIVGALRAAGINAEVIEHLSGIDTLVPRFEVRVPPQDAPAASIIALDTLAISAWRDYRLPTCERCSYPTARLTKASNCPECGDDILAQFARSALHTGLSRLRQDAQGEHAGANRHRGLLLAASTLGLTGVAAMVLFIAVGVPPAAWACPAIAVLLALVLIVRAAAPELDRE